MNIAAGPKSIPASTLLSPEANQAATLAVATGVLTVDLDAIVANWRKLEKTAVPAECAGVVKADAWLRRRTGRPRTGECRLQDLLRRYAG